MSGPLIERHLWKVRVVFFLGIVFVFGVLLRETPRAAAQETYSVGPASAGQVTTLTTVIGAYNRETCVRLNAGAGGICTQAQACTAAGAPGGASCTAAQARGANVRIWPNASQTDRQEFVTFVIAVPTFQDMAVAQRTENKRAFCVAWLAANTTARNNACSAVALSAGCDPGC